MLDDTCAARVTTSLMFFLFFFFCCCFRGDYRRKDLFVAKSVRAVNLAVYARPVVLRGTTRVLANKEFAATNALVLIRQLQASIRTILCEPKLSDFF